MADEAATKHYEINIEGTIHQWPRDEITPAEIRTLGGLPDNEPVLEVNLETNGQHTLPEGKGVELRPGVGFARKVEFKRGLS